jgi:hypothetical protein
MASRADVLKRHGITDRTAIRVQAIQERGSPLWVVGINGVGDPIIALSSKKAMELSVELRHIDDNLASDISRAVTKAQQANAKPKV